MTGRIVRQVGFRLDDETSTKALRCASNEPVTEQSRGNRFGGRQKKIFGQSLKHRNVFENEAGLSILRPRLRSNKHVQHVKPMNTSSHSIQLRPSFSSATFRRAPHETHRIKRAGGGEAKPTLRGGLALLACCAALCLWAGCASVPVPDVATHYDPHTQLRTDLIPDNLLETQGPVRELLWLNASRVFKDRQYFEYYLEVHYEAREETGLLNIHPGLSLTVIADGREFKFRGSGSLNSRKQRRGVVSEDAIFLASAEELRAIAFAKAVTVKIAGQNGVVVRDFVPANFERFRKFVTEFVDKA